MKLRSWLLFLFGSLLVVTGFATNLLARQQARANLVKATEEQLRQGVRPSFEPALLGNLKVLGSRIEDSPTVQQYRTVFVARQGPYQQLLQRHPREQLLEELGRAQSGDGKKWTDPELEGHPAGEVGHYFECWQSLQGLMRDVGVTLFEESGGTLDLLVFTDREGMPFLELRTQPTGKIPAAEDAWQADRVSPELGDFLKAHLDLPAEGYLLHGDGSLYLVRVQPLSTGGQLVIGHRLDERFEDSLEHIVLGAEFRLSKGTTGARQRVHPPYLEGEETLPSLLHSAQSAAMLTQYRSLDHLEAYLQSMTSGIATLSLGVMLVGLVGIWLATQSVAFQMARLSRRMGEVGEGHLDAPDLEPAGPLEVRQATEEFNKMVHQLRHKEMLAKMVPKQAREAIESEQTQGGRVVARRIRTTILFSDIRGFTSLSERLSPDEVMKLLDIYLSRMTSVIDSEGGDVNEYIGDAILADFEDRPEATGAVRAVRAAWKMRLALEELRQQGLHPELATLRQGLGLHTGDVVKGEVGASHRSKFALIGDTVNLAARIQDRSRDGKHTGILLSQESYQDVQGFDMEVFGDEAFKGKSGLTRVWEVVRPQTGDPRPTGP